jgi:predicted enzyme related to lactoylglutathione lyase
MEHPVGTFCFAELHTPDVDPAMRFYAQVFGWKAAAVPGVGGYIICRLEGRSVAAIRRAAGPPRWVPQVMVASVDETAARARQLGATIAVPAFETAGVARTCVIEDKDGAAFGLWEGRGHPCAELQDAAGSMWWVELCARDVVKSREFYTSLFGWTFDTTDKYGPFTHSYHVFRVGKTGVAGALQYERDWGIAQRWQILFAIDDWQATVARAAAGGGQLGFWRDVPGTGRLGNMSDPGGAWFCVMRPGAPASAAAESAGAAT